MTKRGWMSVMVFCGLVFTLAHAYALPKGGQQKGFVFLNGSQIDETAATTLITAIEGAVHEHVLLVDCTTVVYHNEEAQVLIAEVRVDLVSQYRSVARVHGSATAQAWTPDVPESEMVLSETARQATRDAIDRAIVMLLDLPQKRPAPTLGEIHVTLGNTEFVIGDDDVAARIRIGAFVQNCNVRTIRRIDRLTLAASDAWDPEHRTYRIDTTAAAEAHGHTGTGEDHIIYDLDMKPEGDERLQLIEIIQMKALRYAIEHIVEQQEQKEEEQEEEGK